MDNWKKEVDGHIIEYRYGSTGSINPWSLDFADKNNIDLIIISYVDHFNKVGCYITHNYIVDYDNVYMEKGYSNLPNLYNMNSFDDINEYLTKYTKYRGKLQDKIEKLKTYIK